MEMGLPVLELKILLVFKSHHSGMEIRLCVFCAHSVPALNRTIVGWKFVEIY